jgi:hypothetical protein
LATIFGALSLHPKIPFPAAAVEREVGPHCTRNTGLTLLGMVGEAPSRLSQRSMS